MTRGIRLIWQFIRLFSAIAILSWAFALPMLALVIFFSVRAGAGFAIFLGIVPFFLLLVLSEGGLLRFFGGEVPRTHGLRNSYEMAYEASGVVLKTRPTLVTFADPVPNIFVVRAVGGDGLILLSDGLIALLNESELRFVLIRAIQRLVKGETALQSVCIFALALLRERGSSDTDGSIQSLKPLSAFRALLRYPWIRLFSQMAIDLATRRVGDSSVSPEFLEGAARLSRAARLYGQKTRLPGLVYLGIEG